MATVVRIIEVIGAATAIAYLVLGVLALVVRWRRGTRLLPCLWWVACSAVLLPAVEVSANEARCTELGSNCVCAEPFQMTGFTVVSGNWLNPTDTSSLECGTEVATAPITRSNPGDMLGSTDGTALSRLPTNHSVSRFLATQPGLSGTLFIGGHQTSSDLGSTYNARMSIRGYVYHSPDYNFVDESPGCHSKLLQGQVGAWHIENAFGYLDMYQFTNGNWGPGSAFPRDCCWSLPGATVSSPVHADWKGHWFRVEVVVSNRTGPGVRHQLYLKDVSQGITQWNGGNEALMVDWYGTASGADPWDSSFNTVITSSPAQTPMDFNFYREVGAGQCNGWRGISHMMIAGWDTDAGQRIGAATEVEGGEGGGGGPIPFSSVVLFVEVALIATTVVWHLRSPLKAGLLGLGSVATVTALSVSAGVKQVGYQAAVSTVQGVTTVLAKLKTPSRRS